MAGQPGNDVAVCPSDQHLGQYALVEAHVSEYRDVRAHCLGQRHQQIVVRMLGHVDRARRGAITIELKG